MPLGFDRSDNSVIAGDSAELFAYAYETDDASTQAVDISSVVFTVRRPDGTTDDNLAGTIEGDGAGFLRYTNTDAIGKYTWMARFNFASGEKRSFVDEFYTYDPLSQAPETQATQIGDEVWMRLEDCFDSQEGGPWLRDVTLSYFDRTKVERFIPEGLLMVNAWPPITNLGLVDFTTPIKSTDPALLALDPDHTEPDPDRIVIVQATLLAVIKHLMRSYTEQPNPTGANVVWQDRRDYLQRWQIIFGIEEAYFKTMVALWKRQFLHYGKGALLIHSKAGRLYGPGYNRARQVGRGWY